jgi:purine-binding chemotaxis protein CheW
MDFQEIRRKAKERAARAAAAVGPAPAPVEVEGAPPAHQPAVEAPVSRQPGQLIEGDGLVRQAEHPSPLAPGDEGGGPNDPERSAPRRPPPGSPEALRLEAELASRIAALSPAADARFVTWRPDGGPLPDLEAIAPLAGEGLEVARGPIGPVDPLDDFFYREDEASAGAGLLAPAVPGALVQGAVALDEFLIFRLGDEEFGVEIGRVLEVMRTPPVTEVPRAPPEILGVISVRGEVVTVVDPRARLGLPGGGAGPARRVVVVDDGEGACGLLVDQVAGVVRLPQGALEPCPQAIGGTGAEVFLGIGREHERLFTVLDTRALLRPLRQVAGARLA